MRAIDQIAMMTGRALSLRKDFLWRAADWLQGKLANSRCHHWCTQTALDSRQTPDERTLEGGHDVWGVEIRPPWMAQSLM